MNSYQTFVRNEVGASADILKEFKLNTVKVKGAESTAGENNDTCRFRRLPRGRTVFPIRPNTSPHFKQEAY